MGENDFYTILIKEDQSFVHTIKKKIMQRSTGIDCIRFLVDPTYGDLDMTKCNAVLEYVTPISNTYDTITLTQSEELYKGKVEFLLPVDLKLTYEVGDLKLTINFTYLEKKNDSDEDIFVQRVRKIGTTSVTINKSPMWSDYIPDAKLDNIAQIMLKQQSLLEQQKEYAEMIAYSKADGIAKDKETNEIYLTSNGVKLGKGVIDAEDECGCEDGVPVIDFSVVEPEDSDKTVNNVVEF